MKQTLRSSFVLLTGLLSLTSASAVSAAPFDIGSKFGTGTVVKGNIKAVTDLAEIYNPVIFSLYSVGGLVTFFALLYGGFSFIMGAGQADQKKIEQGKQVITWSLIGLVVLISSFWILQIIERITGAQIINSTL